jgi:hypothetical protein
MPQFKDLRTFHDDALKLPIGPTVYRIPAPPAAEALKLRKEFFATDEIPDETHVDLGLRALGSKLNKGGAIKGGAGEQMYANGCTWSEIMRAASTALIYIALGEEFAAAYWAQEEIGGASTPAVAAEGSAGDAADRPE